MGVFRVVGVCCQARLVTLFSWAWKLRASAECQTRRP
jgi:hypothetical protein